MPEFRKIQFKCYKENFLNGKKNEIESSSYNLKLLLYYFLLLVLYFRLVNIDPTYCYLCKYVGIHN